MTQTNPGERLYTAGVNSSDKPLRILTAYAKGGHPAWISKVSVPPELLIGWRQDRGKELGPLKKLLHDLTWAAWMFRASQNYDVVYTGSDWVGLFFAIGQRLMRKKRVPHIFIDFLVTIGHGPSKASIRRLLYRLAVQGSCRVLVQRSCEVESYARALDVPKKKFTFALYHATIYDTPYTVRDDGYVFAGGDSDRDYALLLEAVRGLPYRVIIASLNRNQFQGLEIPENVEIRNASEAEFIQLMAGASVNVVPLQPLPQHVGGEQTYANAMTMGKPTIVTDMYASDYIQNGITGILTAAGDAKALQQAIKELMDNPESAHRMGARAKEAARAFTPEKFFEVVFKISAECVGKRNTDLVVLEDPADATWTQVDAQNNSWERRS
jgi:glycosyltransferase involved in cell wall biosynthesis